MALSLLPLTCGGDDEPANSSSRPPIFDGTRSNFTAWIIAFSAWVAWKLTDCSHILDATETLPDVDTNDPQGSTDARVAWRNRTKIYLTSAARVLQCECLFIRMGQYHQACPTPSRKRQLPNMATTLIWKVQDATHWRDVRITSGHRLLPIRLTTNKQHTREPFVCAGWPPSASPTRKMSTGCQSRPPRIHPACRL